MAFPRAPCPRRRVLPATVGLRALGSGTARPCPPLPPGFRVPDAWGPGAAPLQPSWVDGKAPRVPSSPRSPAKSVRLVFLSQRQKPRPSWGVFSPALAAERHATTPTASCPCFHPGSDSHPGHQPTGSGQRGTGLPHPRLPAASRSDVSFATISLPCSPQPRAGAEPLPHVPTQPHARLGWVPRATPQHPQPSRLPPKVTLSRAGAGSPSPSFTPRGIQPPWEFRSSPSSVPASQQTPGESLLLLTSRPPWEYQILNCLEPCKGSALGHKSLCFGAPSRCAGPLWSLGDEHGAGGSAAQRGVGRPPLCWTHLSAFAVISGLTLCWAAPTTPPGCGDAAPGAAPGVSISAGSF